MSKFKWTAIILTCPNRNRSLAYQKEIKLRQDKGLIDKDSLILCIEDPEKPIGSGGATLNAIFIAAETLSAQRKCRMTQFDVLKNAYVLIMHMGRHYYFDVIGKALSTLPFQDKSNNNLLTNFDLLYKNMTEDIAGLNEENPRSDPGIYICSTDMLIQFPKDSNISIRNSSICVFSYLAKKSLTIKNGVYNLNNDKKIVQNIHFQPSEEILAKCNKTDNQLYPLVSGIVYLNYDVAHILYSLTCTAPLNNCSYIGIDSGGSPLYLSLFFDILLAGCRDVNKEEYLNGSFQTNHTAQANQQALLHQARSTIYNAIGTLTINNIELNPNGETMYVYLDNDTIEHRRSIFFAYDEANKIIDDVESPDSNKDQTLISSSLNDTMSTFRPNCNPPIFVNCLIEKSELKYSHNNIILNCLFKSCKVDIGTNSFLTDVYWENKNITIPSDLFVQSIQVNLECMQKSIELTVVLGISDNFTTNFTSDDWTIFNKSWNTFQADTSITENDLWDHQLNPKQKTLANAKLFPLIHPNLSTELMTRLQHFFWIDLITWNSVNFQRQNSVLSNSISNWRQSLRLSLEDIVNIVNMEITFQQRRSIFNKINIQLLVQSVIENKCIQFIPLIRNAVHDGFANDILTSLDTAALANSSNLILLPRIMVFMSNTLCEMALDYSTLRSGPNLNINWHEGFEYLENGQIDNAICALRKERLNWLGRNDLLIRASRHYEGAMLALIRKATSSFYSGSDSTNKIVLGKVDTINQKPFEWVESCSPARLDLAGAWSDTPPITYECPGGSCVTNVAILINGEKPIGAKGRVIKDTDTTPLKVIIIMKDSSKDEDPQNQVKFELNDLNSFLDYNKPLAVACLVKAVCVFTKLIEFNHENNSLHHQLKSKLDGSLELHTWTGLPQGSGLGTSSILAGCVLQVVWALQGIHVSDETLSYSVLVVEQLMTTNGGWQDQVGGLWGGFKYTKAKNQLPLEIDVNTLVLDTEFLEAINSRLVIIYTGVTRLAKDLLLNVLRNWYAISSEIYDNVQNLVKNGKKCALALESGNLIEFGECINLHRKQKLIMAPGSEPSSIQQLFNILEPHVYGMALAGAGGGGFLYAITKEPNNKVQIKQLVETIDPNMKIYDARIAEPMNGIECKFY